MSFKKLYEDYTYKKDQAEIINKFIQQVKDNKIEYVSLSNKYDVLLENHIEMLESLKEELKKAITEKNKEKIITALKATNKYCFE